MMRLPRTFILVLVCALTLPVVAAPTCPTYLERAKTTLERVWSILFGKNAEETAAVIPSPAKDPIGSESIPSGTEHAPTSAEPPDSHVARNKNTDTPSDQSPARISHRFNQPATVYFGSQKYGALNAATAELRSQSASEQRLAREGLETGYDLDVDADALTAVKGYVHVPFGFEPVFYSGTALELWQRPSGLYYLKLSPGSVRIRLRPHAEFQLSPSERAELTFVERAPALAAYPQAWQDKLKSWLEQRRDGTLTTVDLARALAEFIRTMLKYEVDESPALGVLALCRHGSVQCDGASLILVAILRSLFQVPSFTVGGAQSAASPTDPMASLILDQSIPHMFSAVFDEVSGRFMVIDPTPSEETRTRRHPPKTDPRFNDWPAASRPSPPAPLDTDALLRQLFRPAGGTAWRQTLAQLRTKLEAPGLELDRDQNHLLNALAFVERLTEFLPAASLSDELSSLEWAKGRPEAIRLDHLRLQVLQQLAPFGVTHGDSPAAWRQIFALTSRLLRTSRGQFNSRDELAARLPGRLSRERLVTHPQSLKRLRQLAKLNELVHLTRLKEFSRRPSQRYYSSTTPTDSDDVDFELAEDVSNFINFERNGLPSKYDHLRLAMDDLYERRWREGEQTGSEFEVVTRPSGREATYILIDLSSSTIDDRKEIVRDRLVQSWIDELLGDGGSALVEIIPYRSVPEKETELAADNARAHFAEMFSKEGAFYKSSGANDTHLAFDRAISRAALLGKSFTRVNVRLITDGEEALESSLFRNAKERLVGKELNFTAVTLVTGNDTLKRFIQTSHNSNVLSEGRFVHLSLAQINEVLDVAPDEKLDHMAPYLPANYLEIDHAPPFLRRQAKDLANAIR